MVTMYFLYEYHATYQKYLVKKSQKELGFEEIFRQPSDEKFDRQITTNRARSDGKTVTMATLIRSHC